MRKFCGLVLLLAIGLSALPAMAATGGARGTVPRLVTADIPQGAPATTYHFTSIHYQVYADVDRSLAERIAAHMDAIYQQYVRELEGFGDNTQQVLPLYIFKTQQAYLAFLQARTIQGRNTSGMFFVHSEHGSGLATFTAGQDRQEMLHVLQHEGFHQFAYARFGPKLPIWVNEGLAEYYGLSILVRGKLLMGTVEPLRLVRMQDAVNKGSFIPFARMVNMTNDTWASSVTAAAAGASLQYDQAWSMVQFLLNADNGRYVREFIAYLKLIAGGAASAEAFAKAFGTSRMDVFEARWTQYIRTLKPDTVSNAAMQADFLGQGLKLLRERRIAVRDLAQLRQTLQSLHFSATLTREGAKIQMLASDERWFRPPATGPDQTPGRIELLPSADPRMPAEVIISGLPATVHLSWTIDAQDKPRPQIEYE